MKRVLLSRYTELYYTLRYIEARERLASVPIHSCVTQRCIATRTPFTFRRARTGRDAFTDREDELKELAVDIRERLQDVLGLRAQAVRQVLTRLRAGQEALAKGVPRRLLRPDEDPDEGARSPGPSRRRSTTTRSQPVGQALEKASSLFRGLRIKPTIEIDPDDASLRFSFEAGRARAARNRRHDREAARAPRQDRGGTQKRTALIFDEFQEVLKLDPQFRT